MLETAIGVDRRFEPRSYVTPVALQHDHRPRSFEKKV